VITHEEALKIILDHCCPLEVEIVDIQQASSRVLGADIIADINMPPFNKSAVDGYACRREDLPGPLKILEVIMAGMLPEFELLPGTCSKIMTGAPVPVGADTVVMIEDTESREDDTIVFSADKTGSNICLTGEDITEGEKVLEAGTLLKPWHIGILATVGMKNVPLYRKVNIGIITTGNELVEPGHNLVPGKIRNSNAYQLLSSCSSLPVNSHYYGIVADSLNETTDVLIHAISENDIVLLTGGVSMGDFDFVPQALENAGMNILFDSVAMQPGRPLTYATNGKKHCFGLPGNPVSSMIQFELSVKPLIYKLMGNDFNPPRIPMKIGEPITRKKSQRKSFYPVSLNTNHTVSAVNYHGSAHINAFTNAYGIIAMEQGVAEIKEGEIVYVRPL
jgi:molybdopterin molybdotransferase